MRKIVVFVSLLIIVITVITSLFLPGFISYILQSHLQNDVKAHNINGDIQTHPSFMIATGEIDEIYYTADSAIIGNTEVHDLSLTGNNLNIDIPDLIQNKFTINKADNISLSCSIDSKSLEALLSKSVSRLHNANVEITPEDIVVKADIPLLKDNALATMKGNLYTKDGSVYLKIDEFDVENNLLGKISLNSDMNVCLIDKNKLPLETKIDYVKQKENQILIKASTHKE